jgi:hypothetical protein
MMNKAKYLLNAATLPGYGVYEYYRVSRQEAVEIAEGAISGINHASTAYLLSNLLEREVAVSKVITVLDDGESALVFKLSTRVPEGVSLRIEELDQLEYEFGMITRVV